MPRPSDLPPDPEADSSSEAGLAPEVAKARAEAESTSGKGASVPRLLLLYGLAVTLPPIGTTLIYRLKAPNGLVMETAAALLFLGGLYATALTGAALAAKLCAQRAAVGLGGGEDGGGCLLAMLFVLSGWVLSTVLLIHAGYFIWLYFP